MNNSDNSLLKRPVNISSFPMTVIFVAMLVVFQIWNRSFLSMDNIITMMNSASVYGIIGVGMAIVIICGQMDLSSGYVGCLAGVIAAMLRVQGKS